MSPTPIIDMFSGTGELARAIVAGLSRTARIRLAGNAVVGLQGRLMLQRGLTAVDNIDLRGIL